MLPASIDKLLAGHDLEADEIGAAFDDLLDGRAHPAQAGAFLALLRRKGERGIEIAGAAAALRRRARPTGLSGPLVDTCGTGGDDAGTINLSTAAAVLAAAAGARVAKHGNRSVSSRCGSADVLEALGVRLDLPEDLLAKGLAETGLAFLFAPRYHPVMAAVAETRRALGVRTVFNLAGPLANPAGARYHTLGVGAAHLLQPMAEALAELGTEHALVYHGAGGLDELTTVGPCRAIEIRGGRLRARGIDGRRYGLVEARLEDLRGGEASENARALEAILAGEDSPRADSVVLSAAAALYVAGVSPTLSHAVRRARRVQRSGQGMAVVRGLVGLSREVACA